MPLRSISIIVQFFVLCFLFEATSGQISSNTIAQYSVNDGLAQSTITHILRDKTGYLWVATCGGLNRFDGHRFITFKNYPEIKNSLSDNFVRWLYEDKDGDIWIGTESGLDRWDNYSGEIKRPLSEVKEFGKTWYIPFYDQGGWLYFADALNGISKIEKRTGKILNLIPNTMFSNLTNTCCNTYNYSWLCTLGKKLLIQYSAKNNQIEYHYLPSSINVVFEICAYAESKILLATDKGLYTFNYLDKTFEHFNLGNDQSNKAVLGISNDRNGNWWIALKNDVLLLCNSDLKIINSYNTSGYKNDNKFPTSISRVYGDRDGNIWIGTDGNGLYSMNPSLNKFNLFRFKVEKLHDANFIRCIASSNVNNLFIGTYKGLYQVNVDEGTHKELGLSSNGIIVGPIITGFLEVNRNKVVAVTDNGIAVYDKNNGMLLNTQKFTAGLANYSHFNSICKLTNGNFLAGGTGFLYLMHLENNNTCTTIDFTPLSTISLYNTGHDSIFIGTADGGFKIITVENEKIKILKSLQTEEYNYTKFNSFCNDLKGYMWAATNTGLMRLASNGNFIKLYTENEGLPNNHIYGVIRDQNNNIWFSTDKGIGMLNPSTEKITSFGVKDGLQSEEFNSGAFYQDNEGKIFFGGIDGLTYFKPEDISLNQNKTSVVITNFFVLGDKKVTYKRPPNDEVKLSYFQNFFSIEVAALEFSNPKLNEYSFFLKGQDISWSEPSASPFVRYSNLQPGKYEFWAQASNNDKVWGDKTKLLTIIIAPPIWETIWFRVLSISALVLVAYFFMRQRFVRRLERKMQAINRIREIDGIRAKLSRDLHDSAGASLTKISMMAELARIDMNKQVDIANRLESISKSSRSLIDNFAEIIWVTNPQHDNLESLITYIRTFIADFTEGLPIEVQFIIPENIPQIKIAPDIRHNTFLIAKESVNNAIKHSHASTLILEVTIQTNQFKIRISDNGIGLCNDNQRVFGNGLDSMQDRAKMMDAAYSCTSSHGMGTTIELECPI